MTPGGATLEVAERFRRRLDEECGDQVTEVRVFGSRARGEAGPTSDLDVLPFPIHPLVMSRAHFEHLSRRDPAIAQDIERDGVVL